MNHLIITGGSRRLGLAVTEHFLARGWRVTVLSRHSSTELEALSRPELRVISGDYTDAATIHRTAQSLAEENIDLLIHNASLFLPDDQCDLTLTDHYQQMMAVHMLLPAILNQTLGPRLSQSDNGNIIHMTDIYADNPQPNFSLYCSTKAGLKSLNSSFARILAPRVRVNAIAPGALKFLPEHSDAQKEAVLKGSLIPIEAGFEPVLSTIDYIMTNPFLTGTTIRVDGGRSLCR